MMLSSLEISNFKNIESDSSSFTNLNLISGPNGCGKTNRLEAIYYLCLTRGFSGLQDAQLLLQGSDVFYLEGHFLDDNGTTLPISCGWQAGKKLFRRNAQPVARLADHVGQIPVVLIAPTDTLLVTEGSEIRRRFFDGWLSQCHSDYLDALLKVNKLVLQRNALLKQGKEHHSWEEELIEVLDMQRIPLEALIQSRRQELIQQALPVFRLHYQTMAGMKEEPSFVIEPQPFKSLSEEKEAGTTLNGPHRDKVLYLLNGQLIRKFASQGQQKTFIIALKLAQHDYIKEVKCRKPILLLDDIFEKLDQSRLSYLMALVAGNQFGQVFITDTDASRVLALFRPLGLSVHHIPIGMN